MADTITYSKEIYYTFRDDHGERKVVPVRNVWVAGEWKAPTYVEPALRLVDFNTNHSKVEDYIETTAPTQTISTTQHLFDFALDSFYYFDDYSRVTVPTQAISTTQHLIDFILDPTFEYLSYQKTAVPDQQMSTTHHLYDMRIYSTWSFEQVPNIISGSQPEPILRLIESNVNTCTIENLT
jgi:hypothetical protein